jgi:hypothetical protein
VNHLLSLVHGIGASLACGLVLYVAGLIVIRRRWEPLLQSPTLALIGAAAYVLLCWIAVSARGIALVQVIAAFCGGVAVLSLLRARWVSSIVKDRGRMRAAVRAAIAFSLFYIVAYVMTIPPASNISLPPAWTGDLDLLTYAQYARHLFLSGSTHLPSASFDYRESPAVTFLLAFLSVGYAQDPLRAAMPLLFSLVALTALAVVQTARSVFGLSMPVALAVVSIFLTGPLLRYVSAAYLVGWLAAFPLLMYLLWAVRNIRPNRFVDASAITAFTCVYTLLFFLHPSLVFAAILIHAIAFVMGRHGRVEALRYPWREAAQHAIAASIPIVLLAVVFADRVRWGITDSRSLRTAFAVSHLSPLAWMGWPGRIPARLDAELPAGVVVLFLSALTLMLIARWLVRFTAIDRLARAGSDRRLALAFLAYAAIGLVAANIAVHAVEDRRLTRMPGYWRAIEQLRDRPFAELTFRIDYDPRGLLAAVARYYLPDKTIHVLAHGVRTRDLPFETVSRQRPLLIQGFGCEGVGHRDVVAIDRVGCVLLAPPTLEVAERYPFNRTTLAIEYDGMGERDPGGRWTTNRTLSLRVTIDPERTRVDRTLYVNILVNPFLPAGDKPPRLVLAWGSGSRGDVFPARESWFSIPVATGDWSGNRLWTVRMRADFPERRRVLFRDLSLTDHPLGALPASY